jgi:hypothetical protein
MKVEAAKRLRRCIMLRPLQHGPHHFGDLIYTTMERAFLTAGAVALTLAALLVMYFGIFLLR